MKAILGSLAVLIALAAFIFFFKTPSTTRFETGTFGGVSLRVEFALTDAGRELGLGGRANIPGDYGMLFVFSQAGYYGFWMKDTLVPLDIFWFDDKGQVVYVAKDVATSTYPNVFKPSVPATYVLETSAGFSTLHNIATGTTLYLQSWPAVSK